MITVYRKALTLQLSGLLMNMLPCSISDFFANRLPGASSSASGVYFIYFKELLWLFPTRGLDDESSQ
jgi:hypothetical protein